MGSPSSSSELLRRNPEAEVEDEKMITERTNGLDTQIPG